MDTHKKYGLSGLCVRCGQRPPINGCTSCRECLDKIASARNKRSESGMCNRCGKHPHQKDSPACKTCDEKQHALYIIAKKQGRQTQFARMAADLCEACGKRPPAEGLYNGKPRTTCNECALERRKKMAVKANQRYSNVLARDNFTCQICGRQRRLHVHHIDGNGLTHDGVALSKEERNDSPDNLITLCGYCHYAISCLRQGKKNVDLAIRLLQA